MQFGENTANGFKKISKWKCQQIMMQDDVQKPVTIAQYEHFVLEGLSM